MNIPENSRSVEERDDSRETGLRPPHGFHPVIDMGDTWQVLDFTKGYDPEAISLDPPSIGRYNEKRRKMYTTGLFKGVRNIHMGIDIWVPAGTPVCAFAEGRVLFFRDNDQPGDYGPTIVTEHFVLLDQGSSWSPSQDGPSRAPSIPLYALFGHLSRASLEHVSEDMPLDRGQPFAEVGDAAENGGWVPHLHFQLSRERPAVPDMPGVVAPEDLAEALWTYPDPQQVLGPLY